MAESALVRYDRGLLRKLRAERFIGVDEAGRGPLAGPVVVGAVELPGAIPPELNAIKDSKLLAPARRERLFSALRASGIRYAAAWAGPAEIERLNILRATLESMRRAVQSLGTSSSTLVGVDGNRAIAGLSCPQLTIVEGDRRSWAIAAASVVAKVLRDRWMRRLDYLHPGYGFAVNKGYGTPDHLAALSRLGPSPVHRRNYAPVLQLNLEFDEIVLEEA